MSIMADTSNLLRHYYVTIDGADAPQVLMNDLFSVTVESSVHLPDVATLVLHDTHLKWIDDDTLMPGKPLQVSTRADRAEVLLFDGEIVEIEPDFGPSMQRFVVRALDRLHRLARGRRVRSFQNVTDGDLAQRIAQEAGLKAQVGPAPQVHSYVLQANETNLAFLQKRAAALGYLLFVRNETLHFEPPQANGAPIELKWAENLLEFRPRLTTVGQVDSVTVRGWDPATRQEIVGQAQNGQGSPQIGERRSGGELARDAFHLEAPYQVADRPVRSQAEADRLAQAVADRRAGRFIEAEGRCAGTPALVAGAEVQVRAVGDRFGGRYVVTCATHRFDASESYTTRFVISGHHPATLLSLLADEQEQSPASSLLIGLVTDNQDPEGLGRVKVKYPSLSGDHASDWARIVVPGGGADRGLAFLPEVNDEVLVGFELGDIHHPYVIGGLWNGRDKPPRTSDEVVSGGKVQQRVIRSRTGHEVILDDQDGKGGITIQDNSGNKVVLDTGNNALTVEVAGNVGIKAKGDLMLKAEGKVEIDSGKNISVKGSTTVDVKANVINLN